MAAFRANSPSISRFSSLASSQSMAGAHRPLVAFDPRGSPSSGKLIKAPRRNRKNSNIHLRKSQEAAPNCFERKEFVREACTYR